jgi:hypothetical protein
MRNVILAMALGSALIGLAQQPAHAGMSAKGFEKWMHDQDAYSTKCADDYLATLKAKGITVTMTEYYKNYGNCGLSWSTQHVEEYQDIPD